MDLQSHIQQIQGLDDDSLLRSLKRHVGSSNRLNALVLAHLAEVDARGAYRQWACDTLAAYCVYELRLSEDEAQRRCRAARVARQFPVLFEMLADASIHLTGIVLLAPYLTAENHREVLARARYRRKREIELLVAELAPARDVPALIEPLSARVGAPQRGGWAAFAESRAGWVRELVSGDGPRQAPSVPDDWHEELVGRQELDAEDASAPARREVEPQPPPASVAAPAATRYKVQFTADQAYVDLLEQARALLWHRLPSGDLAQLQRLALEALVEKLVCRKYGAGARSGMVEARRAHPAATDSGRDGAPAAEKRWSLGETEGSPVDLTDNLTADEISVATETSSVIDPEPANGTGPAPEPSAAADSAPALLERSQGSSSSAHAGPEQEHHAASHPSNSRHVPAAVRSAVWLRDEGRCTVVDPRGVRCRATTALELHHEQPFVRGGPATPENIRVRCRAHNELAAEQDFGREHMLTKKRGRTPPDVPPG